jgi:hypothetical protein
MIEAVAEALPNGVTICTDEDISDSAEPGEGAASAPSGAFAALERWKRS